jgi:SAM-dependent methyltransferase
MAAIFLVFQQGVVTGYDGGTMYEVTRSMVDGGTFSISGEWNTLPGPDGLEYSRYGLGLSLLSAVPYVLARPVVEMTGHSELVSSAAVASLFPLIAAALIVALFALGRRLGAGIVPALVVGVGAVVGTFMLPYSKEFFSEPLTALLLVVTIERLLAKRPASAGLALGLGVLTRPQTLLFVPVVLLVAWRRDGIDQALRAMAGLAPGVVATLAYNVVRFGDPMIFGYQDVGFTTPFLTGARGLMLEPTKSVLLFAPVVVLLPFALRHLMQRDRWASVLLTANLVITFVVTATWFSWHGGWCWGPRLLLPGLIPCLAAIGPWSSTRRRLRTTGILLMVGSAVSLPAFIVSPESLDTSAPPPETHFLDTQPLSSPSVVTQIQRIPGAARYSVQHPYEDRGDGLNRLRTLSLWQLGTMRALGRPGVLVSAAGTVVLLGVALVGGRKLRLALRDVAESSGGGGEGGPTSAYPGVSNLEAMEAARNYNDFLTSTVLSRVDASRPVLDFGAGTGTHARRLRERGLDVRCVEPDPQLRRLLEQEGFAVAADIRGHGRGSFASIYSLNVLEHIEDDEEALRQLFAVTDAGGRLILYVPAFQVLFSAMDREVGHVRRYRMRELRGRVRGAGFEVLTCRYVDGLGFFAAFAYRLLARSGELNPRSVARYDSWFFPISRALDNLTDRWIGKNLLLEARRD